MISLGVIATGLVDGGPPIPTGGPGLKMLLQYGSAGMPGIVSGGEIPAVAPSFHVFSLSCDKIYQRYRVMEGVTEISDLSIMAIDGDYAICANPSSTSVFITPYHVDEDLEFTDDWELNSTLIVGVSVSEIDLSGASSSGVAQILVIQSGKFLVLPDVSGSGVTVLNAHIVDYSSPTSFSVTSIEINLSSYSGTSGFYFSDPPYSGSAVNYTTGELAFTTVLNNPGGVFGLIAFLIDKETGAIEDSLVNIPPSEELVVLTSLAILSEVTQDCFENKNTAGDFNSGENGAYNGVSGRTTGMLSSDGMVGKATFSGRSIVTAGYQIYTDYEDLTSYLSVSVRTKVKDKLEDLGYTVVGDVSPGETIYYSPCVVQDE